MAISKNELTSDELYDKYNKVFESSLKALVKKYKSKWENVVLAQDCPRNTIWRCEIFPAYKKNRDGRQSSFDPAIFAHTYTVLLPELNSKYPFRIISHERAEADDVIAVAHAKIRDAHPNTLIYVLSQDTDFLQLQDSATNIRNFNDKLLCETVPPEVLCAYVLWKTIRGDPSDNIPPIDKKVGDKTAIKMVANPEALAQKLSQPGVQQQFDMNKLLIDFKMIPNDLRSSIAKLI